MITRRTISRVLLCLNPLKRAFSASYLAPKICKIDSSSLLFLSGSKPFFPSRALTNSKTGFVSLVILFPAKSSRWRSPEAKKHFSTVSKSQEDYKIAGLEGNVIGKIDKDKMKNPAVADSASNKLGDSLSSYCPAANSAAKVRGTFKNNHNTSSSAANDAATFLENFKNNPKNPTSVANDAAMIQRLLQTNPNPTLEDTLNQCGVIVSKDLVLQVLSSQKNDCNSAMFFFTWAAKQPGYSHGTEGYNAVIDILGKNKRFSSTWQLVCQMHKHRPSLVTDETFNILIRRYASAHMVERAYETFYRRTEFGLELNKPAFQVLLDALCKHRHAKEAEALLNLKQKEFPPDMKSHNIILNGWCAFANLREAKRYWNEMIKQGGKPNLITCTTFINALAKKSKLNAALTLFEQMWDKGCTPDVPLCNAILDALCLKKGIPAALDVFGEMNERGCLPDVATYNTLIKHTCNVGRVDKAYELLDEMESRGCSPNVRTYHYFLRVAEKPEETLKVFQRMVKTGCTPTSDTYNLILKMLLDWNEMDRVFVLWQDMERNGMGPDQRSYTVMVHGLHEKGKFDEAYKFYNEMTAKGFIPEPKTELFGKAMEINAKGSEIGAYDANKNTERNNIRHRKTR